MPRLHLFEIEDQRWCPRIIREIITDFLSTLDDVLAIFEPAYQKMLELLIRTHATAVVDCCSGSAGPMINLRKHLDASALADTNIILTDKFPNRKLFQHLKQTYGPRLSGIEESIDAMQFPSNLTGVRCFFSSFHHFKPQQALNILQDAANHQTPIAIFECTERRAIDFIRALLSPLIMWSLMPFSKRLNWRKFVFIYLLPIAPLAFLWDYFVSNLRSYSTAELHQLVSMIDGPQYQWEIGRLWSKPAKSYVSYMVGYLSPSPSPAKRERE